LSACYSGTCFSGSCVAANHGDSGIENDVIRDNHDDANNDARVKQLISEARYHEIYGRNDLRQKLLTEASELSEGRSPAVNWMNGKIIADQQWMTPEEYAEKVSKDASHEKYLALREKTRDNFDSQLKLAQWCHNNQMTAQARAHLNRCLWHDADNSQVRALLGHRQVNGVWLTPEEMAAEALEFYVVQQRINGWKKPIADIISLVSDISPRKQNEGWEKLRAIDDVTSVNALEVIAARQSESLAKAAVRKISEFDELEASLVLMRMSLSSPWKSCRDLATKALAKRDHYDYVPTMLSQMATKIISRVNVIPGARRQVLYNHVYFQQTMDRDIIKQYDTVYQRITSGRTSGRDSMNQTLQDIRQSVPMNERMKEWVNRDIEQRNKAITTVLEKSVGLKLGDDPTAWWKWWNDHNEVYTAVRPVDYDRYQRQLEVYDRDLALSGAPPLSTPVPTRGGGSCECLVAGTLVWTDRGAIAVEKIAVGDRVLSQNIETGELSYKTVLRPTVRPVTPTLTVKVSNETIRASGGHPFWVSGQGWVKVRDLKPGMLLGGIGGTSMIQSVNKDKPALLYNLVVDRNANYFVGKSKILSHDNSIPTPTRKQVPGLAE